MKVKVEVEQLHNLHLQRLVPLPQAHSHFGLIVRMLQQSNACLIMHEKT